MISVLSSNLMVCCQGAGISEQLSAVHCTHRAVWSIEDVQYIVPLMKQGTLCRHSVSKKDSLWLKLLLWKLQTLNQLFNRFLRTYTRSFLESNTRWMLEPRTSMRAVAFRLTRYQTAIVRALAAHAEYPRSHVDTCVDDEFLFRLRLLLQYSKRVIEPCCCICMNFGSFEVCVLRRDAMVTNA